MKKILVPTDFSACADRAAEVAIQLAEKIKAELHFVHLMSIPIDWVHLEQSQEKLYPDVTKRVKEANHRLCERINWAEKKGLTARHYLHYNESYAGIVDYIHENSMDLVVMGSHGASGLKGFFLGSITQRIARLSSAPVLVIKENTRKLKFDKIVFASNFEPEMDKAYKKVVNLAKTLGAKLHLLFVNTPSNFTDTRTVQERMESFKKHANGVVASSDIYDAYQFEEGITEFCEDKTGWLVAMATHGNIGVDRFFTGSLTEYIINRVDLPLLSVHVEDK